MLYVQVFRSGDMKVYKIAIIADLDTESRLEGGADKWRSYLR